MIKIWRGRGRTVRRGRTLGGRALGGRDGRMHYWMRELHGRTRRSGAVAPLQSAAAAVTTFATAAAAAAATAVVVVVRVRWRSGESLK